VSVAVVYSKKQLILSLNRDKLWALVLNKLTKPELIAKISVCHDATQLYYHHCMECGIQGGVKNDLKNLKDRVFNTAALSFLTTGVCDV